VEFLGPIAPGLGRAEFLAALEHAIEGRSQELIAEATGQPVRPSVLVPAPDEIERAAVQPA
jgi:1-acyl-sn-glycerol-3-phosphate acyltransferase